MEALACEQFLHLKALTSFLMGCIYNDGVSLTAQQGSSIGARLRGTGTRGLKQGLLGTKRSLEGVGGTSVAGNRKE